MKDRSIEQLAGEYALGVLGPAERKRVEALARSDAALAEAITRFERQLAPLARVSEPVAPPTDLFVKIEARIGAADAAIAPAHDLRLEEGSWITLAEGIAKKTLWNRGTFLLRIAPGATVPEHAHGQFEHCVVISGTMVVGGHAYRAGDYQGLPAGTTHAPITSPDGALVLIQYAA